MKYAQITNVPVPVSRLVLGTMIINTNEMENSFALLDAAVATGFNALDMARIYGGGESEHAVGEWMKARGNRDKMVLVTKGCHPNFRARVTRYDLGADILDSLHRLNTTWIDIYLLHRDDLSVPVGEIVEALNEHYRADRIRTFGGSNWTVERIEEANDYARKHGLVPFTVSSPNYSLAVQVAETWTGCLSARAAGNPRDERWYAKTQMPLFAWSSLARGFLSGRFTRSNMDTLGGDSKRSYLCEENLLRLDRAETLAREKGCSVAQIAMAWVLAQPLNIFACVGAANAEECRANAAALDLDLTPKDLAWLDLKSNSR